MHVYGLALIEYELFIQFRFPCEGIFEFRGFLEPGRLSNKVENKRTVGGTNGPTRTLRRSECTWGAYEQLLLSSAVVALH